MKNIILMFALIATNVYAAPNDCKAIGKAIENGVKEQALYMYGFEPGMTSGDRAKIAATIVQTNLSLMSAKKCRLPAGPLDPSDYLVAALRCRVARTTTGASNTPDECTLESWKAGE